MPWRKRVVFGGACLAGLLEISAGLCIPCSWPRLRPRPTPLSLSPKRQGKTRSESNAGRASSQGVVFGLSA